MFLAITRESIVGFS